MNILDVKNIWYDFFEQLPLIKEKIETAAKRGGISADAALLLTVIYEYTQYNLPIKAEIFSELISKGFIEENLNITSRGAIFAKSLIQIRNNGL